MSEETKDEAWREMMGEQAEQEQEEFQLETCVGCEKKFSPNEDGCGNLIDLTYCKSCFEDIQKELGENQETNVTETVQKKQETDAIQEFTSAENVCYHLIAINQPNADYKVNWKGLEYYLKTKSALKARTNLFECVHMLYWCDPVHGFSSKTISILFPCTIRGGDVCAMLWMTRCNDPRFHALCFSRDTHEGYLIKQDWQIIDFDFSVPVDVTTMIIDVQNYCSVTKRIYDPARGLHPDCKNPERPDSELRHYFLKKNILSDTKLMAANTVTKPKSPIPKRQSAKIVTPISPKYKRSKKKTNDSFSPTAFDMKTKQDAIPETKNLADNKSFQITNLSMPRNRRKL